MTPTEFSRCTDAGSSLSAHPTHRSCDCAAWCCKGTPEMERTVGLDACGIGFRKPTLSQLSYVRKFVRLAPIQCLARPHGKLLKNLCTLGAGT